MRTQCGRTIINKIIVFTFFLICSTHGLDFNLRGKHGEGYYVDVSIGEPPQFFKVIVDTGSSNFAIAASKNGLVSSFYNEKNSSTYNDLMKNVSSQYIQGSWHGKLGSDILKFPTVFPAYAVRVDISEIKNSSNFFVENSNWQGILGLAYPDISRPDKSVLSWIDSLQQQGNYSSMGFLLELCGTQDHNNNNHYGTLQVLTDNIVSQENNIFSAPLVRDWYFQITVTGISVNGELLDVPCRYLNDDKTIIDSGSTNLGLPEKVYDALIERLNNYTVANPEQGILTSSFWISQETSCFDTIQTWDKLPNISISIARDKNSYFVLDLPGPSYVRRVFGNVSREVQYCYKVAIDKSATGTVLGVVTLEGYTVVFNRTAETVSFTKSGCGPNVGLRGVFKEKKTNFLKMCNTKKPPVRFWTFMKLCLIPVFIILAMMLVTAIIQIGLWLFRAKIDKSITSVLTHYYEFLTLNRTQLINED